VKEIMNVEPYRIWQNAYAWLVNRYVDLEDYVSACKTLETAYVFKPASESAKNWESWRAELIVQLIVRVLPLTAGLSCM
jgi:hypothetical protein